MSRTAWAWDLLDDLGQVVDRPLSPTFTNRFDAEAWLGETWRTLAGQGVVGVQVTEQGVPVGPVIPLQTS